MEIFRDLGCVQFDPLRAVERTQLLVLRSRLGTFDTADLKSLLYEERQLFECVDRGFPHFLATYA